MEMLRDIGMTDLRGKHAVVVGRSNIVGKPMAMLLLHANATVTICHSGTKDLAQCRQADILVAAVGRPRFIKADMVKPGAVVIDVGINRLPESEGGKLVGDVDSTRSASGGLSDAGARRCWPDDHHHAAAEHAGRGEPRVATTLSAAGSPAAGVAADDVAPTLAATDACQASGRASARPSRTPVQSSLPD